MADQQLYYLKGHLLGACSCDWGCPCSFEARPTQGFCEGNYVWHIEEGQYQGDADDRQYLRALYSFSQRTP